MKYKAFLSDFDGTIVTEDLLDVACEIVGKRHESEQLNADFRSGKIKGLAGLIRRINLLSGLSQQDIYTKLQTKNYLRKGTEKLFAYLKQQRFLTILYSGNIIPILEYYQKLLQIDYIVGSQLQMNGDIITGISESDFKSKTYKLDRTKEILQQHNISPSEVIVMGDSVADIPMFDYYDYAIAIGNNSEIVDHANTQIENDLELVTSQINLLNS